MTEFTMSTKAYVKMVLHALKYPHSAVNGVLIGSKDKATHTCRIHDSIPLFHMALGLAPMLEIALAQIDSYCQLSRPPLQIVGYYHANERLKDISLDGLAMRIAEKVQSQFSDALLFLIDNSAVSIDFERPLYRIYQFYEHKWKPKEKNKVTFDEEERALSIASAAIQSKLYRELVDFDQHLDDISMDFLNRKLELKLDQMLL